MNDAAKTKQQLLMELADLRSRIAERPATGVRDQPGRDALDASEIRFRRLFESAKDGILILDAETGDIDAVNPFLADLLGYSRTEMEGKKLWEIGPFKDTANSRIAFTQLQNNEYIRYDDLPLETKRGKAVEVEFVSNVYEAGSRKVIQCNIRDISDRKRVDARVRLQSAALDAAATAIVVTDRDGRIEWVNPAFAELTGYSAAESVGRDLSELVKSGQHDRAFYRQMWDTILAGRVWRGEMVNRRKDGTLYAEEQAITPVHDADGVIRHFIGVKLDITDRKQHEEEIRARAELLVLRAAIDLSLTTSASLPGALQECAESLVTHLAATRAEIWTLDEGAGELEMMASAGVPKASHGPHARTALGEGTVGRLAREAKPCTTNAVIGDPAISDQAWAIDEKIVAFSGYPLMAGGRVVGVMTLYAGRPLPAPVVDTLAFVADHIAAGIEHHRNAEDRRALQERTQFALANANVGIWDMDFVTGVARWSAILEAQHGLAPGTFAGTFDAYIAAVHPDDRAAVREADQAAMKSGEPYSVLRRVMRPDGSIRWLRDIGRIELDERAQPSRGIGISLDETDRHLLEAQFQQAQKMEAVGRLAGGVAHDFNNLLTSILGYCELLLADLSANDPHRGDIEEIHRAGMMAASLTRQLLAFSRQELIAPSLLDLNVVVGEMQPMLQRLIGEDVEVVVNVRPAATMVKADRGQLEQVVMNLALNARDAMPDGGRLTIATSTVDLDEEYTKAHLGVTPGAYAALTITDTGTGMTPEVQARLFEPFFTTKGVGKGTGLGLSTVHGIVKQSDGSIGVYSEVGLGTSFKVYLPLAEAAEAEVAPAEAPVARRPSGPRTVLVVDDAEGLRELTRRLLEHQGYTVVVAANAEEAMRRFDEHPAIDVLLTDVVMPGASGPELTRELMKRRPELRVVYMSGYTDDAIFHHGVLAPGIAFVHKPFTADVLGRAIHEALSR